MTSAAALRGVAAPGISARNQHGETVDLASCAGRPVLVMFYPFAFSRVCGSELSELSGRWSEVRALDALVLAVSCDAVHTLRAFAEELGAPDGLELLSDFWPHGGIARRFAAFSETNGAPRRTSFILDSTLTVQHVIESGPAEARSLDETLSLLSGLQSAH
ncbi:redoxin domain-containing protein [Nesterenkonia sp. NBAIMH1]|uniref:redoxin domain-containing protein n=1 Tax=Nesterenkonia sp. NBAIMH1 TaxID=2600320 RepID=UPI00143E079D|nr:redoxin domain-containing protein [Nesterenkonia sp. NBAIMH1]